MHSQNAYPWHRTWLIFCLLGMSTACVHLAGYDQKAYENATSLKAQTLALLDRSTAESFDQTPNSVNALRVELSAAYEYANGIQYNNEAAKNWRDLIGDEDTMINGWLSLWQRQGSLSQIFAGELRATIAEGFDLIICLEANKRELTACEHLKRTE